MENLFFFTTLRPTLEGAWIPALAMVLVQFIGMAIFKEGGKRAVDTSWYDAKTKMYAMWKSIASRPTATFTATTRSVCRAIFCSSKAW